MTIQDDITASAQSWTHVVVDGVRMRREPWDPVALGKRYGNPWMDETTQCNDCEVAVGQLHWILCGWDYIAGTQLLGTVSEAAYCTDEP